MTPKRALMLFVLCVLITGYLEGRWNEEINGSLKMKQGSNTGTVLAYNGWKCVQPFAGGTMYCFPVGVKDEKPCYIVYGTVWEPCGGIQVKV